MTVELRPLGVSCNLQCQYCYQNPQREAGNLLHSYDIERMKEAIRAEGGPFSLFGGEPLMIPVEDLEALWSWGLAEYGGNSIQTNGTLISDRHVQLFKKYKVQVGISLDGPDELNDVRWHHTLLQTRDSTARAQAAVERLCAAGIPPSLIITLHRNNATAEKLPVLLDWVRYVVGLGVRWVRLHLLESESEVIHDKYALSTDENIAALLAFFVLQKQLPSLHCDVFDDMRLMLLGQDGSTTCVWNACDPWTTRAVRGVEGNGQRSNCGRTNKDGIDFVKADREGLERYIALYHTPQEYGGCKGCRFFLMCKGQCPGTALDGDWRNRSEHCEVWKKLYAKFEQELVVEGHEPISLSPRRGEIERAFIDSWARGENVYMSQLLPQSTQDHTPGEVDWRTALAEIVQEFRASLGAGERLGIP
jgi:uncharacterized protein